MKDHQYIREVILSRPLPEDSYLCGLPAVQHLMKNHSLPLTKAVTFFVGENGTGKSTLIEGIAAAYGFNPEGGSKNFHFSTNQSHSELWEHLTLSKSSFPKDGFFLRAESFYNVASNIDELNRDLDGLLDSYGGISLHQQSHGESFLALVQNRFWGNGLYIMDEPEAALSPTRILTLMVELRALTKKASQFIIATHSPILMSFPGAQVYEFTQDGIRSVDYRETEHYQLTRRFLENPEKMFRYLFEE